MTEQPGSYGGHGTTGTGEAGRATGADLGPDTGPDVGPDVGPDIDVGPDTGSTDEGGTGAAAREESRRVGEHAKSQARDVQATAKQEASRTADEAKQQARHVVEDARTQLQHQAQEQTDRLAGMLDGLAGDARALAEGRVDDAGELASYARDLSDRLQHLADRIGELGWNGTLDEVGRFARRRPGAFLLGAAAAGFTVTRLARGAKDASSQEGGQPSFASSGADQRRPAHEGGTAELPPTTTDVGETRGDPALDPATIPPQPHPAGDRGGQR